MMGEEATQKRRRKILVVEDQSEVYETLCRRLEENGYGCVVATSGVDAVAKAVSEHPDLVLSDVRLNASDENNRDGIWVLGELKRVEATKGIPVIVMTGYGTIDTVRMGFALGASRFIEKGPGYISNLIGAIQEALLNAELGIL